MRRQLQELKNWFLNDILHSIIIILLISFLAFLVNTKIENLRLWFYYPEQEYQNLEAEVKRITPDFNTNYHYVIKHYDNKTNTIEFNMFYDDSNSDTYLSVNIDDFGTKNQVLKTSRNFSNVITHTCTVILYIIIFLIIYSLLFILFLFLIYMFCCLISLVFPEFINNIKNSIKKRKEKNNKENEIITKENDECDEDQNNN